MENTHFVDDDVASQASTMPARAWPLEALATAPMVPFALRPDPPERRSRNLDAIPRQVVPRVDVRDEWAW